jgi:hypothetical protein
MEDDEGEEQLQENQYEDPAYAASNDQQTYGGVQVRNEFRISSIDVDELELPVPRRSRWQVAGEYGKWPIEASKR